MSTRYLARPSCGRVLTCETTPISIPIPSGTFGDAHIFQNMGEYRTLSTFLHSSWGRGRVNLIFWTDLAEDIN